MTSPAGIADELSPMYVGASAITLSPDDPTIAAQARTPYIITVDYTAADPEGVTLPLELLIAGPSPQSFVRRLFRRDAPVEFSFTPIEGGTHQVLLREVGHNRWSGTLTVEVQGDTIGGTT